MKNCTACNSWTLPRVPAVAVQDITLSEVLLEMPGHNSVFAGLSSCSYSHTLRQFILLEFSHTEPECLAAL